MRTDKDLMLAVKSWCDDHPSFDAGFIDSVYAAFKRFGKLTQGQRDAVESIVENIDLDEYG